MALQIPIANLAGLHPNGDSPLVFADLSADGGQAQMLSWGVNITALPEPINVALVVHGARRWRRAFRLLRSRAGKATTRNGLSHWN